jgi:hypothetical protein
MYKGDETEHLPAKISSGTSEGLEKSALLKDLLRL